MKINYKDIEDVKYGEFTYGGEKWSLKDCGKNQGTSASGLWNVMTNGHVSVRVYKKDVSAVDAKKAIALFNK